MKKRHILTALLTALLLALAVSAGAQAAEVRPIPVDHDLVDLGNGEFCLTIMNADRIEKNGFFTAVLYQEDRYDGDQIRSLAPGDAVYANDEKWTVQKVVIHSGGESPDEPAAYEIYTEEELDGYLAFEPRRDATFVAVINDWNPVVLLGSVQVWLPLPDDFAFVTVTAGEENEPTGADAFVDYLNMFGQESFTAYNTTCAFKDGMLVRVTNFSYPYGPEEDDGADFRPVPVWKFCHGLRDGLDTAVITGYETDCEEGLLPIGSVVILKNTKQKMMICGICQQVEEENGGVLYDYSALLHPYGYVSKDYLYVFNQESIEKVCSIGYIDERLIAAYKNVNALLPRVRSGELPLEELEKIRPERPQIEAP